jgi:hypothetical protein
MDDNDAREALMSSDQRVALEALRDRLVDGVLAATDRRLIHLAPLSKQLMDVLDKLKSLPGVEQGDDLDDLVARRAARIAAAKAG